MCRTDDPIADFERYDAEQEAKIEQLPICCRCKEHIQQEYAVHHNDKWYCEDCEEDAWEEIRDDYLTNTRREN